jgi:hypothetical protein
VVEGGQFQTYVQEYEPARTDQEGLKKLLETREEK